jgi:Bacterial surface proteins containing Ig-like domains
MSGYQMTSVRRPRNTAGRPAEKRDFIVIGRISDLDLFIPDPNGVDIIAFAHKPGSAPIGIYQVPASSKLSEEPQGDAINSGYIQKLELDHPGTDREITLFRENNTGEPLYAIQVYFDPTQSCKISGYPGNPLFLKSPSQDDKDVRKSILRFEQAMQGTALGLISRALISDYIDHLFDSSDLITPAAPTNGVVDDLANTFAFTAVPGYSDISDYEYSSNKGVTATVCSELPIKVGDENYKIGDFCVRVKALAGVRNASAWLYNQEAFTKAIVIIPVSSINITGESMGSVGKTIQLAAAVLPANATNKAVTWHTYDDTVATVDANGLVTLKKNGGVTISAVSADGLITGTFNISVVTQYILHGISASGVYDSVDGFHDYTPINYTGAGTYDIATNTLSGFNFLMIAVPFGKTIQILDEDSNDVTSEFTKTETVTSDFYGNLDLYKINNVYYTNFSTNFKVIIN